MRYVHTNIVARDWRQLAHFYQSVFQCRSKPPPRQQRGPWLSRGTGVADASLEGVHLILPGYGEEGPTLEIYQYGEVLDAPPKAANREGFGHLAFEVTSVPRCVDRLLEAGGTLAGEIVERDIEGVGRITFVYAKDPEGNLIELQSWV